MGDSLLGNSSVLDFLGPWPLRLVWVVLIVGALWALIVASWRVVSRRRASPQ